MHPDTAADRRPIRGPGPRSGDPPPPVAPQRRAARRGGRWSRHRGMLDVSFLDHLIGPPKERRRDCKAERLGRLEVDHELELCWLLDWKFAGFGAPENLVYVGGGPAVQFRDIRTVRH